MSIYAFASLRLIPLITLLIQDLQKLKYHSENIKIINNSIISFRKKKTLKTDKNISLLDINNINIKNLSFVSDGFTILKNLNLQFKVGKINGVIGSSGSGKTTLLDIISGIRHSNNYELYLDKNKSSFDNPNWIKNLSYCTQNPYIFRDTIKANILIGKEFDSSFDDKIHKLLSDIGLSKKINSFDEGIYHKLNDEGLNFSIGQKHRIGIVRSIFSDKDLMIFDEPSSALDKKNKIKLIKILKDLKDKKKTIIISSHNEDLINHFDNLINIDNLKK